MTEDSHTVDAAEFGVGSTVALINPAPPGEAELWILVTERSPTDAVLWLESNGTSREVIGTASVSVLPRTHDGEIDVDECVRLVRAGEIVPLAVGSGGQALDIGPRAVPGIPWIRSIRLPLGIHNRGSVNAFVIETGVGLILVDAGLATEISRLTRALAIAGVRRGDIVAITCTHLHADHVGGASGLRRDGWLAPGAPILLGAETDRLGHEMFIENTPRFAAQLRENGVPESELDRWQDDLATMADLADWPAEVVRVRDGDTVTIGGVRLDFWETPGHCPDHITISAKLIQLAEAAPGPRAADNASAVVFLGDMTLGRAMPRCGVRDWVRPDPIEDLRESWQKVVQRAPGARGLPAHGAPIADVSEFSARLTPTIDEAIASFAAQYSGKTITAAEIMASSVTAEHGWGPRMFAFYDALAMLKHLAAAGAARLVERDPDRYRLEDHG